MSDTGKSGALDWAARVAMVTVGLYAAVIAFEVGFFWRLGGAVMATFSPTEHAVHAVGELGIVGMLIVAAITFLTYPNLVLSLYQKPEPVSNAPATSPNPPNRIIFKVVTLGLFAIFLGWSGLTVLVDLYKSDGLSPLFFAGVLLLVFIATHAIEINLSSNKRSYRIPLAALAAFALPACGSIAYKGAMGREATLIEVQDGTGRYAAKLLFSGSDKMLYELHGRLFLGDLEGNWHRQILVTSTLKG